MVISNADDYLTNTPSIILLSRDMWSLGTFEFTGRPTAKKVSGVVTSDRRDVHAKGQGQRSRSHETKKSPILTQIWRFRTVQYIPRNMHTVFALLCFVVVIHWLIVPYPSGLLHWHCGNLTIAPVPAKQPWWIWINTSCEFIMNDCITTTKQSTTKPCAYFLGYTVTPFWIHRWLWNEAQSLT